MLYRFETERTFDLKNIKHVNIKYNTKENFYAVTLPCVPACEDTSVRIPLNDSISQFDKCPRQFLRTPERLINVWKLRRLTDTATLQIDDSNLPQKFEADFDYGFAGKFKGKPKTIDEVSNKH